MIIECASSERLNIPTENLFSQPLRFAGYFSFERFDWINQYVWTNKIPDNKEQQQQAWLPNKNKTSHKFKTFANK